MEKQLLLSRIQTPDGTILTSYHRHHCVFYTDKNGLEYMLDGGPEYQRCFVQPTAPHIDVSIYTDTPYEELREVYGRGGYGKDGNEPFKYVPLCQMSNEWLKNAIIYTYEHNGNIFNLPNSYYMRELIYRQEKGIIIEDNE